MKTNRVLAALIAAAMILALAAPAHVARALSAESYNAYDTAMLKLFFEQKDGSGVKNGEKLFEHYDPNDPGTWTEKVEWNEFGRVQSLSLGSEDYQLYGTLNVSGMTELTSLECAKSKLTTLNAAGCTKLGSVEATQNEIKTINLEGCTALWFLDLSYNKLTKITIPYDIRLVNLNNNPMKKADLSGVVHPQSIGMINCVLRELHTSIGNIKVDLDANGGGCFDFEFASAETTGASHGLYIVGTNADEGFEFAGWYDKDGDQEYTPADYTDLWNDGMKPLTLTAVFRDGDTEPEPTEPGETDPEPTEPGETDPEPTEPGETDPEPTEPAETAEPTAVPTPTVPTTGTYGWTLLGAALATLGVFAIAIAVVTLEKRSYDRALRPGARRR